MKKLEYTVRFNTPAFLGDAEQNGRWRTPPFKAQLRQWWRVTYAADHNFNVNIGTMRREEGLLFGNAWLSHQVDDQQVADHSKSLVRIRLERWDPGTLKKDQWPADSLVTHPEVTNKQGQTVPVGSALYLGYGPLIYDNANRRTTLKANAAIQAGEATTLAIAYPDEHDEYLQRALWLMHCYGTVGGRSRNGWGSFALIPVNETPKLEGALPLRNWKNCLNLDWPHAIGQDDKGPLIWQTAPHDDWKALMKTLAIIKIGLRTQFKFPSAKPDGNVHERHWLSYPVTKHDVRDWKRNNLRLPNQLRFKVRRTDDNKFVGVIFHIPHLPPAAFNPDRQAIEAVWQRVHQFLDAPAQKLTRASE